MVSGRQRIHTTNMFFNNLVPKSFINNSITSGELVDLYSNPQYKITLENIHGNFFASEKIVINLHGLNVLNSINKDGSFCFGTKLKDLHNKSINDYLVNPNKQTQSDSCFKIVFDQSKKKYIFYL